MKGTETQLPLPKRLLSVFFAIVLVVGLVPVTAWAEGDESQQSQNAQTSATQEQAGQAQAPETVTGGGETSDSSGSDSDSAEQNSNEAVSSSEEGIAAASLYPTEPTAEGSPSLEFQGSVDKKKVYITLNGDSHHGLYRLNGDDKLQINSSSTGELTLNPTATGKITYNVEYYVDFGLFGFWRNCGTLTLNEKPSVTNADAIKDGFAYDGDSHKWEPTLVAWNGSVLTEGNYSVIYKRGDQVTNDFTSAGTISVHIEANNNYTGTFDYNYTIKKAEDLNVSCEGYTGDYDGQEHFAEAKPSVAEGTKVEYSTDGKSWSTDAPTVKDVADSKTVQVRATNPNYSNTATCEYSLTVTPAAVTVSVEGKTETVTYDGQEHSVSDFDVTSVEGDAAYLFSGKSVVLKEGTTAKASGTNANAYKMNLTESSFACSDGNFEVSFGVTDGSLTIAKRAVTLTSATDSKVYDGTALTKPEVTVGGDGFVSGEASDVKATGSVTDVSDGKVANTITFVPGEKFKDSNYDITKNEGELSITPVTSKVTVTITGKKTRDTYDGTPKSAVGYETSIDSTLYKESDFTFSGNDKVEKTDAGTYKMGLAKEQFANKSGNFTNVVFVVTDGELAIAKRAVTLKSADLSKQYDGTALTNGDTALETETGWVNGEGATYKFTGSQLVVGNSANAFDYTLKENTKASNYEITKTEGSLNVTSRDAKYEITVKANSTTADYDGKEHSATGVETSEFTVEGNKYTVSNLTTGNPKATDAGTYSNNVSGTAVVKDEYGNDVSSEFEVTTENGSLVINRATVTLKSADLSKTYDGSALVNGDTALAVETGFAEGEGASYTFTGSQTNAGSSKNTFAYTLNANTKADNYTIKTPEYGTLKVDPVSDKVTVTITEKSDSKVYNGAEQSVEGYTPSSSNKLYTDSCFSFVGAADHKVAKGTDAGTYGMGLEASDFKNVSENFTDVEFVIVDGELTITQREVELTSATDSKVYDGTELTKPKVTVGGDGFVSGEVSDVKATGSVTNVSDGKVTNTITFVPGEKFKESNYKITKNEGELWIEQNTDEVVVTVAGHKANATYDGAGHTASGYDISTESGLYNVDTAVKFSGTAEVTGTEADTYAMGLSADQFENTDANFSNVTFEVEDGSLTIDPAKVSVAIAGKSETITYDGQEHSVSGFEVTGVEGESSELFDNDSVKLAEGIEAEASGTDAGDYGMGLYGASFVCEDPNFFVTAFDVTDGKLTVEKRAIEVNDSASVVYNGQEQVLNIDDAKATGLVDGDTLYLKNAQVKGTQPGTYTDVTEYSWDVVNNKGNVKANYDLKVSGTLTITAADSGAAAAADNGNNAKAGKGTAPQTGDATAPFAAGAAFAAAAALVALFASRRFRRSARR